MAKLGKATCGVRTELETLRFEIEVSVTKDGMFTTTLDEGVVAKLVGYGIPMKRNRLGREGFFESSTYDGLVSSVNDYVKECLSATLVEEKEVIQYVMASSCHYCEGDERDGFEIYPNCEWVPEHLKEKDGSHRRWKNGTENNSRGPYSVSVCFRVVKKQVWKFQSGREVVKYEYSRQNDSRSNVDWLKSVVRMDLNGWGASNWDRNPNVREVDATEENASVFVQVVKFICKASRFFSQLTDPELLLKMAKESVKFQIGE